MEKTRQHASEIFRRPGKFLLRVLTGFRRNQGLLLAGAVAYYTLLSVIPMLALILVGL
ncbi:MAG: ribonuclease R, partial [Deltaproteobacteria bacterium]|nr:ribonuclease R [Deltaproteobacteria bacterium]